MKQNRHTGEEDHAGYGGGILARTRPLPSSRAEKSGADAASAGALRAHSTSYFRFESLQMM